MVNQQVVPPTRLGLVLSIIGFAGAVALMASDAALAALRSPYGLTWVVLVIVIVYPPRMIRPGTGWARARCRSTPAALLYGAAVLITITGATVAVSSASLIALGTAGLTLVIAVLAATLPAVTRSAASQTP